MSKIMSQTKSRGTSVLQCLQLLQHPQTYLKHKTRAENELLEDFFSFTAQICAMCTEDIVSVLLLS